MKHLFFALCVALLLSTAVGSAQQQPKKAVIEGVVSAVGTAAPIPAARVTLARQGRGAPGIAGAADRVAPPAPGQPGGPAGPRGARGAGPAFQPIPPVMTDEAGHFVFQDVDEGSYTISVIANGYVGQSYGQRYSGGPGTPINVVAGQEFKDAAVALTPAGNISGRIVDPFDQPLINVPIQVFRYSYDSTGQRSYQSAGNAVTDDRGEYRIYWLTPGRYYLQAGSVSAGPNSMLDIASTMLAPFGASTPNANIMPIPLNYAYYPGVTSVADARPIDLLPGAEVGGIDLRLTPRPKTFRVRGRLIDPRTNMPPANASVTISPQSLDPTLAGLSLEMVAADLPSVNYNAATGGMDFRDLRPGI
ncbi:MAG TPA: carboxypeptidase-like regulatory domain-containing protein [Terriglobia bacterium]|nr:carboxypeptidase-like regulatory domain-containing protein [Terriglobia bacterium]